MAVDGRGKLRPFLAGEALTYVVAALIHAGLLVHGGEHHAAMRAEGIIAIVLIGALLATWAGPGWTRGLALGAQAFALLATLVGIFTIIVGIGPRTVPDVIYHIAIVIVLAAGLVAAARAPRTAR